jgi:hypothetical protein
MHTDESILPSSRKIKWIVAGIPCVLALYVLSIGPAIKLTDAGMIGERAGQILGIAYAPLGLLVRVPGADHVFRWYVFQVWECDRTGDISS